VEGGEKTLVLYLISRQRLAAGATENVRHFDAISCRVSVLWVARNPTVNGKF